MKRWLSNLLIVVFVAVFLVSGFFLGRYYLQSRQSKQQFDALTQLMEQARPTLPPEQPQQEQQLQETTAPQQPTEPESDLVTVHDPVTDQPIAVLPELADLYLLNPDLEGWIAIPDTNINYPMMHTPDRTDYYLYRDFYGEDSVHGCIYIREQCVLERSDNVTIYGHRMKDGSMFNNLLHYEKKSYYDAHKYIQLSSLTQRHTYEIISVFKTVATASGFDYHLFTEAADQADFEDFVKTCKALSLYDTGVSAQYGDKLITLSTCEYSQDNGRMVIVAKRIG